MNERLLCVVPKGATRGSGFSWEDESSAKMPTAKHQEQVTHRCDFRDTTTPWLLKILPPPAIVLVFPLPMCSPHHQNHFYSFLLQNNIRALFLKAVMSKNIELIHWSA